ncbi:MAG: FAD-dependent oxidoreductase [Actinomycetaceae bacterium]|nr:FAD-dependent oxidoreductase [Actinomycetaceae bacterium]
MASVVVVGGGYGGITVAGGLDEVADVTLIEQKDQFVHHAAVDSVWGHTIFMPYSRLLKRGKIVHGTAMRVEGTTVYVAGQDPIEGDYLVLATGTTYPFPAKHQVSQAAVAKARLDQCRANLANANRVLLVGAGTVGVEFAGEISATFPDLQIIMVDRAPHILGTPGYSQELIDDLTRQLKDRGVELVLGAPLAYMPPSDMGVLSSFYVETTDGVGIEADMWFICYGARTATGYFHGAYSELLHGDGTIMVNEYMQVRGTQNVYAVGDITDVPESKRADAARAHARVVVANIKDQLANRAPSTTYSPGKEWIVLPLGPDGGASQLVTPQGKMALVGPEETAEIKGSDLMVTMIRGQLHLP